MRKPHASMAPLALLLPHLATLSLSQFIINQLKGRMTPVNSSSSNGRTDRTFTILYRLANPKLTLFLCRFSIATFHCAALYKTFYMRRVVSLVFIFMMCVWFMLWFLCGKWDKWFKYMGILYKKRVEERFSKSFSCWKI